MAYNWQRKNYTWTLKDFYTNYKKRKKASGFKHEDIMTAKQYEAIMEDFFIRVCRKIVREGYIFTLPFSLGCLYLKTGKVKPGKETINWPETLKAKKKITYGYLHTFGAFYMTKWQKSHVAFKNKRSYVFHFVGGKFAKAKDSGRAIIHEHIMKVSRDPNMKSIRKL